MQVSTFAKEIENLKSLSQSVQLGLGRPFDLKESANVVPWQFSTMYAAKNQTKRFITIHKDEFDPKLRIQWLMADYLAGKFAPLSFDTISEYISEAFVALGRSTAYWERIYAFFIGVGSKEAKQVENVGKKSADHVHDEVTSKMEMFSYDAKKYGKAPVTVVRALEQLVHEWITAYACSILSAKEFSWIVPGIHIEDQLLPDSDYPTYDNLITIVQGYELLLFLNKFNMVKHGAITQFFSSPTDKKRRVSSVTLAHATANEIAGLHQGVTQTMDAEAAVESLFYIWRFALYPELEIPTGLPNSVLQSGVISDLSRNYTFYHIHNENVKAGLDDYRLTYAPTSISEFVFTHFENAMNTISPFSVVTLDKEIEHLRKVSSKDHLHRPTLIQIFENPKVDSSTATFTVSRLNKYKFLNQVPLISDLFVDANERIASAMTFSSMMELDRSLHNQTPVSKRMDPSGTAITLSLPSLLMASVRFNLDPSLAMVYADPNSTVEQQNDALIQIVEKVLNDKRYSKTLEQESSELASLFEAGKIKVGESLPGNVQEYSLFNRIWTRLEQLRRSVYIKLMVIAIKKSDSLNLVHHDGYTKIAAQGARVGLQFTIHTNHVVPLSISAIHEGVVKTTEPLEALLYVPDWDETTQESFFAPALPSVEASERHDNRWDWHQATVGLRFSTTFKTTMLRGKYSVDITERDLLRQRDRVRFVRRTENAMLVSTVSTWVNHTEARLATLEKQVARANEQGDVDVALATRGVIIGILQKVIDVIQDVSRVALAQQYAKKVRVAIPEQMRGRDLIDHASEVNSAAFDLELSLNSAAAIISYVIDPNVWTGLLTITRRFSSYNMLESMLAKKIAAQNNDDMLRLQDD